MTVAGAQRSDRGTTPAPLGTLSVREREVLALMAAGRSNAGIAEALLLSPKTVETHVRAIFAKLELPHNGGAHRRVTAVLVHLEATGVTARPAPERGPA